MVYFVCNARKTRAVATLSARIVSFARMSSAVTNNSDHVHHGRDFPSCKTGASATSTTWSQQTCALGNNLKKQLVNRSNPDVKTRHALTFTCRLPSVHPTSAPCSSHRSCLSIPVSCQSKLRCSLCCAGRPLLLDHCARANPSVLCRR